MAHRNLMFDLILDEEKMILAPLVLTLARSSFFLGGGFLFLYFSKLDMTQDITRKQKKMDMDMKKRKDLTQDIGRKRQKKMMDMTQDMGRKQRKKMMDMDMKQQKDIALDMGRKQ